MNKTFAEIKTPLLNFLRSHQLMAISTFHEQPWIANVYYAVDEELNFYFVSNLDRIHSQHILNQPLVACSVYDSTQTPLQQGSFSKVGVQLSGSAKVLTESGEIEHGLALWKDALMIQSSNYFSVKNILSKKILKKCGK